MSEWVRARHSGAVVAAAVFRVLGMCRAKARALKLSRDHEIAGNTLKSQVYAKRAQLGMSGAERSRLAAAKRGQLEERRAARAAAAAKPAPEAEAGSSLKRESARGKKSSRVGFFMDAPKSAPAQGLERARAASVASDARLAEERARESKARAESKEKPAARVAAPRGGKDVVKLAGGRGPGKVSAELALARARERLATRGRTAERLRSLKGLKDLERAPEVHARPGQAADVKTSAIHFDAERFQYKLAHGQNGSVGSLAGVKKWDPELAGAISVWRDPANGKVFVVNGHNRLDLARKLGVGKVHVKFLEAEDAAEARAKGALTNIAEGRGTALDAAKFFRDAGIRRQDLAERGIPMREAVATQGLDLAALHPHLFRKVVDGDLSPARAAILGGSGLSHADQKLVHDQVAKLQRGGKGEVNDRTLRELIDNAKAAPRSRGDGALDLFGGADEEAHGRSLALHRADIQGALKSELAREKKLFGLVSKSKAAEDLAERGRSSIDTEATGHVSREAAGLLGVFDTLKNRSGPVGDALNRAAEELANRDYPRKEVIQRARRRISKAIAEMFGERGPQGPADRPPP
jgi:hypothetical protein